MTPITRLMVNETATEEMVTSGAKAAKMGPKIGAMAAPSVVSPTPTRTPMSPPRPARTVDSMRNCWRIARRVAPIALRMPI